MPCCLKPFVSVPLISISKPLRKKLSVRLCVDGQLREIVQPRRELAPLLVSRIKVMAKLDIAEKRVPQDGRIYITVGWARSGCACFDITFISR